MIESSELTTFENMMTLERLFLDLNGIEFLEPQTFTSLTNLRTLELSRNKMSRLNSNAFGRHEYLETLYISYNQIDEIQRNFFENFPMLRRVLTWSNVCIDSSITLPANFNSTHLTSFEECFSYRDSPRPSNEFPTTSTENSSTETTQGSATSAMISMQLVVFFFLVQFVAAKLN
jgi:Leucine-rich repeat (LRR) protein